MEMLNERHACVYEARICALWATNRMLIELLRDVKDVLSLDNPQQRLKSEQIQEALDHLSQEPDTLSTHFTTGFFGL